MSLWDSLKTGASNLVDVLGITAEGAANVREIHDVAADIREREHAIDYQRRVDDLEIDAERASIARGDDGLWPWVVGAAAVAVVVLVAA